MSKNYSIVGMNFLKTDAAVAALQSGAQLTLVREPTNRFDPNAVQVWSDGKHIGYLPKKQNAMLAAFIDAKGRLWSPPQPVLATDEKIPESNTVHRAIDGAFVRSPNSGFPMVEVESG